MEKLIQILLGLGLIAALMACPTPTSNSTAGGSGGNAGSGSNKPFEVSPDGLDRTAWRATEPGMNGYAMIILEKDGKALNFFQAGSIHPSLDIAPTETEAKMDFILQKMTGSKPEYVITKFVDNDAYLFEHGNNATGTSFLRFENSQKGAWLMFLPNEATPFKSYDLQRIPYSDFSSKATAWTLDTLDGQKWIYPASEGFYPNEKRAYQYPMVFKKDNDEIKVYLTSSNQYPFSSAEEAFAAIDTDANHNNSGTVTNINNAEHSITIELKGYPQQGKWKLYYADNDYTGLVCLSYSGNGSAPLPSYVGGGFTMFTRYKK